MTTHAPTPRSQNQPSLPNQPFFLWLRTHTTLFIGQIIGLLGAISVPIALIYYSVHSLPENFEWQQIEKVGQYVVYFHLLFLIVVIGVLIGRLDKNNIGSYRARLVYKKLKGVETDFQKLENLSTKQVAKFKRRFLYFWCAMFCLYLSFAVEPVFSVTPEDCLKALSGWAMFRLELFPILSFALNNLSLIFIFCCFVVLYLPRDGTPVTPEATPSQKMWSRLSRLLRRIVQKCSRSELDEPELRQRTLVLSFVLVILALTLMFPLIMLSKSGVEINWSEYPAIFDALSGTINAVVLALLIARLDSKLIGLPSWLICVLYFYAGVQPMFVVFELHPEVYAGIKTAVLWVVFIFKIYFFLIILFSLQTGRIFNYFFCSQVLDKHVKTLKQHRPLESAPNRWARCFKKIRLALRFFAGVKDFPPAATLEEDGAEHSSESSSEQPATEGGEDLSANPAPQNRRAGWFKKLGAMAMKFLSPAEEDWRAIWIKRLGVAAMVFFAGSLLSYVWLSEKHSWMDSRRLSNLTIYLHLFLLAVILIVIHGLVVRDWIVRRFGSWTAALEAFVNYAKGRGVESSTAQTRAERRSKSDASDKLRFEAPSELRFRLSEPMSERDREAKREELSNRTQKQFKAFTRYFRMFWFSLLFLYAAMCLSPPPKDNPSKPCPTKADQLQPTSEGKASAAKEALFVALAQGKPASYNTDHDGPQADDTSHIGKTKNSSGSSEPQAEQLLSVYQMMTETKYPFIFFVVNNFSVLFLFWCFTVLYVPHDDEKFDEKRRLLRNYSLLVWVLLTVLIPLLAIVIKSNGFTHSEVEKLPTILGAVGGTLNAVAFALLIARLDSRMIGLRKLLVAVLYAYAALQPLFVTFNQPSNLLKFIATSAMIAAFIFKICLVLMVGHVRRSGGLIDYLWFFPVLSKSVNSIFDNQFEISAYSPVPGFFTFSVFHKNVETYKAAKRWDIRADCDYEIKLMVKAMEKRGNYSEAPQVQGTRWVQVKDGEHLFCESIGLSSQAEVNALINESIEKVPYCKYDRD